MLEKKMRCAMRIISDGTKIIECDALWAQLVPQCSDIAKAGHVTLVKGADSDCGASELLKKAGYSVSVIELDSKVLFAYNAVAAKIVKEESRLVVGIGADYVMDSAKVIAGNADLPLLLVPSVFSALCAFQKRAEFFSENALVAYYMANPAVVLVCKDVLKCQKASEQAVGLGYILAYIVAAVDHIYEGVIHNRGLSAKALRLIKSLISVLAGMNTMETVENGDIIAKSAIEIAEFASESSSSSSSAFCLAWYISLYKREKISYNSYSFIAAYVILELYRKISNIDNMLLPADRDLALRELQKHCGIDYSQELKQSKIGYAEDYNRRSYITADYLGEFKQLLSGDWLANAAKCYRRLIGNSGYNINKIITSDMLLRLLSLSGESCGGYPLLKHIKLSGLLERYI